MSDDLITIEAEGEHLAWSNELNAMKDELKKFEDVLASLPSSTNAKKIEHFQNQFLIQKSVIDDLKNEIQKHDLAMEHDGKEAFETIDALDLNHHNIIREKIDTQFKIIKALKAEFQSFLNT